MEKIQGLTGEAYWNHRIARLSHAMSRAMGLGKTDLAQRLFEERTQAQTWRANSLRVVYR